MKQVIERPEQEVVIVKNVSPYKFYGVSGLSDGQKGIIQSQGFVNTNSGIKGKYNIIALDGFTNSNMYGHTQDNTSLKDFIVFILSRKLKVYEFDKFSELAKWVEEGS